MKRTSTKNARSTRSILQSLGQIDTEIAESIKPFMHYINQLLKNLDINKVREGFFLLKRILA